MRHALPAVKRPPATRPETSDTSLPGDDVEPIPKTGTSSFDQRRRKRLEEEAAHAPDPAAQRPGHPDFHVPSEDVIGTRFARQLHDDDEP